MKTRIKIVHFYEGRTEYYPEVKGGFFWNPLGEDCPYYLTLEQAEESIDRFLTKPPIKYVEYPSNNPKFQLTSTETEYSRFVESGGVTVAKFNCSYAKARELQRDRLFEWDGVLYAFNSWCDNNTLTAIKVNKVS